MMNNKQVTIEYTNYKGETRMRRIMPKQIVFSSNEWHPQPQWLLEAHDHEKDAPRTFALKDI
ncbi:MAG: WYL domain-containing protein, partial [Gammaproteobacteria bacterium]|nr:WYL domain-containing protein [Gammaproteobacteria bacterium]